MKGGPLRLVVLIIVILPSLSFANQAEILRCAAELKAIHPDGFGAGIFHINGLVLGSARLPGANGQSQAVLFVSNLRVSKAFALGKSITRLRVQFPNPDPRQEDQTHFIQYSHSDIYGSKIGEAYVDITLPGGAAPSDYLAAKPIVMSELAVRGHILQLIADELSRMSRLHLRGKLSRADLLAGNLSLCKGLKTDDSKLSRWLDSQVAELEVASTPVRIFNRIPAGQ